MATFLQAAIEVLRASERPMTTREIAQTAMDAGLIAPGGKTPERSMSAALYEEANRNPAGGIRRIAVEGDKRAVRGSVRWALSD
jgi:HB1, ASXL, restriction endonuclease HTH domain